MKPSLVLWDWNGTLLDDVALCVDALNRLLRIYHYPQQYSLAQYRETFGFPIVDYYIRAGFDFSKNSYKELADDYMQDYLARAGACPLAESAVPALSLLKDAGVQQVILSASNMPVVEQQVTGRGVRPSLPYPFERCRGAAGHSFGFQLAGFGTAGHGARSAPLL